MDLWQLMSEALTKENIVHLEQNYVMSTFLKIHFFAIFELLDIEL